MAKIVKPKLTNAGSDIKITNYTFNNKSNDKKREDLLADLNNQIGDYFDKTNKSFKEKIVNPNLNNILKDGSIESFLQQFHIFDYNDTSEDTSSTPAAPSDSSQGNTGSSKPSDPKNTNSKDDIKNKSVDELAREVIEGKYGTGQARKDALGDRYDEVQKRVDELLKKPSSGSSPTGQSNSSSGNEKNNQQDNKPKEDSKPKEESKPAGTGTGKTTQIPSDVKQTGIIANYTQNYGTRGWVYDQGKLAKAYKAAGSQADGNMATINGRYMVAVSPRFGKVGDNIDIQLANGKVIHAVIADVKGSDATSSWGHVIGGGVDVVEWEINGTSQSQLSSNLKSKGWYGSKVTSITNTGSGHYF